MAVNSVEINNLTKKFDNEEPAIDNLTLNVEQGKIVGLIGPDGAGKTTLIRLIAGLLTPTNGDISTLELSPTTQKRLLNEKIGYMPQKFGLYEDLSVIENLNLYAELKEIPKSDIAAIFDKE